MPINCKENNMIIIPKLSNIGNVCFFIMFDLFSDRLYQLIKYINDWNSAIDQKIIAKVLNNPMNVKTIIAGNGNSLTEIPRPMAKML